MNDRERDLYESAIRAKETAIRELIGQIKRLRDENRELRQGRLATLEVVCVGRN